MYIYPSSTCSHTLLSWLIIITLHFILSSECNWYTLQYFFTFNTISYWQVLYTTAISLSLYLLHSSNTYVDVPPYVWQVAHIYYVVVFNYHIFIPFSRNILGKSSNGLYINRSCFCFASHFTIRGQVLHLYFIHISYIITPNLPTRH